MPLTAKIGGQTRYIKDKEAVCLMEDQAKYIYRKVETENIVNVDTIKQEIEADKFVYFSFCCIINQLVDFLEQNIC